jgi:hypothetical protein
MTDNHSITPPPELVEQWLEKARREIGTIALNPRETFHYGATQAARWGADQELDACCKWVESEIGHGREWNGKLRATRRPKPPSLNSIALQMLGTIERDAHYLPEITDTIRKALEQLDD